MVLFFVFYLVVLELSLWIDLKSENLFILFIYFGIMNKIRLCKTNPKNQGFVIHQVLKKYHSLKQRILSSLSKQKSYCLITRSSIDYWFQIEGKKKKKKKTCCFLLKHTFIINCFIKLSQVLQKKKKKLVNHL